MKKRLSGLSVLVFLSAPLFAGNSQKGTSAANFLKITPGARAAAMGGSLVGAADDAGGLFDNPAGLARLTRSEFTVSHLSYFQGIKFNYLGFVLPLASPLGGAPLRGASGDARPVRDGSPAEAASRAGEGSIGMKNSRHALGFSITSLGVDGLEKRVGDTDTPDSSFEAADYSYQASYARQMNGGLSAGASVKAIRERIDTKSASAVALDLGAHWSRPNQVWRGFGLSLRHLGTKMKFSSASDPLPLVLSAGANARLLGERLSLVTEAHAPRDRDPYMNLGGEFSIMAGAKLALAARAGYSSFLQKLDGARGLSLGFGLGIDPMTFDFAWVPYGDLGNTFRYSLLVRF